MLIQFKLKNSDSFKDENVLHMAKSIGLGLEKSNIFESPNKRHDVLKSACVYGPNASGKSNLIGALNRMRILVRNSAMEPASGQLPIINFKLNTETEKQPTCYEVCFIVGEKVFRYGFEASRKEVVREWLFGIVNKKEIKYFEREKQAISISSHFKEGDKSLQTKTRSNALFISVVSQFNGPIATTVTNWFKSIVYASSGRMRANREKTLKRASTPEGKRSLMQFLKAADIGIEDISVKAAEQSYSIAGSNKVYNEDYELRMAHKKFNQDNKEVGMEVFPAYYESDGTARLLDMFGHIQDVLSKGGILIVDELERDLHSLIVEFLIKQFNCNENKRAQLIATTHDLNTLTPKLFRRDQLWFTEKDPFGASKLFSLCEFKGVRKTANFARDYKLGKFNAIPNVDKFFRLNQK